MCSNRNFSLFSRLENGSTVGTAARDQWLERRLNGSDDAERTWFVHAMRGMGSDSGSFSLLARPFSPPLVTLRYFYCEMQERPEECGDFFQLAWMSTSLPTAARGCLLSLVFRFSLLCVYVWDFFRAGGGQFRFFCRIGTIIHSLRLFSCRVPSIHPAEHVHSFSSSPDSSLVHLPFVSSRFR